MKLSRGSIALLWILYVAVIAHLLYSALGINLIDDGFTLAYSRRLLEGQTPHRDFVIIRPALSPLLHVPEVLVGGDYTYWLSRFVAFLQFACIAWFGTAFVNANLERPFSVFQQCAFALVAFLFGCHSFPLMAWHTIDGLLLAVLGLYGRTRPDGSVRWGSYLFLGAAMLCKQSFVFVAPAALLIFGDWRKWRCVLASALPGLLYLLVLVATGAFRDGMHQLLAQTGIKQVGVERYNHILFFSGLTAGIAVASLLFGLSATIGPRVRTLRRAAGFVWLTLAYAMAVRSLYHAWLYPLSFTLFGMGLGVVLYLLLEGGFSRIAELQVGAAVTLLAWSASLSLGYNTPVLGSGLLIVFLFALAFRQIAWNALPWRPVAALAAALAALPAFHQVRTHHIYREWNASKLNAPIDTLLPGAALIRTNPNTHAFLADLNAAIEQATTNGMSYAILPEVAAHWPRAKQANPVPIDWAKTTELPTTNLVSKVTQSLEARRNKQVLIVQKVTANSLQQGFLPLEVRGRKFDVVRYVKAHFEKIGETRFFTLYR